MQLCPPACRTQRIAKFPGRGTLYLCVMKNMTQKDAENSSALLLLSAIARSVKRMGVRHRRGEQNRTEWFSSYTDSIRIVTGDWALRLPPNVLHSPPPPPMPVIAPLPLPTRGACEVSPERQRFKDGIYKIHTEPTFNCL